MLGKSVSLVTQYLVNILLPVMENAFLETAEVEKMV